MPSEAVAPQGRHLVRQLVDLQLLVLELLIAIGDGLVATCDHCGLSTEFSVLLADLRIAFGELGEQRRGQIPQLICVHLSQLARQLHGLRCCHIFCLFNSVQRDYFIYRTRIFARSSSRSHGRPTTMACSCSCESGMPRSCLTPARMKPPS